jgi:hypothetical protein
VTAWYAAGTAVGQAFICWTAAAYVTGAVGRGGGRVLVAGLGGAVLVAAARTALRSRAPSVWVRPGRNP